MEEATWEREDTIRVTYPFLFEDEGALSNIRSLILELELLLHMHVLVCASMYEFREQNSIKEGRMQNSGKLEIFKNGKMIIIIIIN